MWGGRGKEKRRTKKGQEQRRPGDIQGDGQKEATALVGRTTCHHQTWALGSSLPPPLSRVQCWLRYWGPTAGKGSLPF